MGGICWSMAAMGLKRSLKMKNFWCWTRQIWSGERPKSRTKLLSLAWHLPQHWPVDASLEGSSLVPEGRILSQSWTSFAWTHLEGQGETVLIWLGICGHCSQLRSEDQHHLTPFSNHHCSFSSFFMGPNFGRFATHHWAAACCALTFAYWRCSWPKVGRLHHPLGLGIWAKKLVEHVLKSKSR